LALLPSGERTLCYRSIADNVVLDVNKMSKSINLSEVYMILMNKYYSDKDMQEYISE